MGKSAKIAKRPGKKEKEARKEELANLRLGGFSLSLSLSFLHLLFLFLFFPNFLSLSLYFYSLLWN